MRLPQAEIDRLLDEDLPHFDLTTHGLGIGGRPGRMVFRAGADMVPAGLEIAAQLVERAGARVVELSAAGGRAAAGDLLLAAEGPAGALLAGWKVAQTLVEYMAGIATATRRIVDVARAVRPDVAVACTRKAFPGGRRLSVAAILAGGAVPHRLGLSETVLVFPEHRAFLAGEDLAAALARLKAASPERKLVVEVGSFDDAMEAAGAGADVVQLEKFPPEAVARVVAALSDKGCLVAAAGGVRADNAAAYAAAGAAILVTSAPYSAPPLDVKVTISRAG